MPTPTADQVIEQATQLALDAMCAHIQQHLGVTSGDFAGIHCCSGSQVHEWVHAAAISYFEAERAEKEGN